MFNCIDCDTNFFSQKSLNKHKRSYTSCEDYKHVSFLCEKCDTFCKGIKNINLHMELCDGIKNCKPTEQDYRITIKNLQEELQKFHNIEKQLVVEKIKNQYCNKIIEQKLGLDFSSIFEEKVDGFHYYDIDLSKNINIHIHKAPHKMDVVPEGMKALERTDMSDTSSVHSYICEESDIVTSPRILLRQRDLIATNCDKLNTEINLNDDSKIELKSTSIEKKKATIYRVVKNIKLENEETKEERELRVNLIEAKLKEKIDKPSSNQSLESITSSINECFESLKSSKSYVKILDTIKKLRGKVMCRIPIQEYIELIKVHNTTLTKIFTEVRKPEKNKSISSIIARSMSPIELRLVFYDDYQTSYLDADDIESFDNALTLSTNFPKEYTVFRLSSFLNNFYNYNIALFPIQNTIKKFLFNRYGFHNVIYLKLPDKKDCVSDKKDSEPFSFYFLEEIRDDIRCWKLDCRLEDFSIAIVNNIFPFVVNTFRQIYLAIFNDNIYRPNYRQNCQITECECEQLLRNILILADPILFSKTMRELVMQNAKYIPTTNDKFNLKSDDKLQNKRFQAYKFNQTEIVDIIKSLFDNMEDEDAINLFNEKFTNL